MDLQSLPDSKTRVPTVQLEVPIMCTFGRSILISAGYGPTGYAVPGAMVTLSTVIMVTTILHPQITAQLD